MKLKKKAVIALLSTMFIGTLSINASASKRREDKGDPPGVVASIIAEANVWYCSNIGFFCSNN